MPISSRAAQVLAQALGDVGAAQELITALNTVVATVGTSGVTNYVVPVRDGSGAPLSGLTPAWTYLKDLDAGTDISPQPSITEISNGHYKFSVNWTQNRNVAGIIDFGASAGDARYADVILYQSNQMGMVGVGDLTVIPRIR